MPNLEDGRLGAGRTANNAGAWFFVNELIEDALTDAGKNGMRPRYAGRTAAASQPRPA
jgi:2-oxoglutarate dehydrogenase E1 component